MRRKLPRGDASVTGATARLASGARGHHRFDGDPPLLRQLAGDRLGLARAAQSRRSEHLTPRTKAADRMVRSICPYCAVGCGQRVYVSDERVIHIEGDPDSPISRGRLCPKGAAPENLVNSPMRETRVKYRRPGGTEWEYLSLEEATDMIADRVIKTRRETCEDTDDEGRPLKRTLGMHFLGGWRGARLRGVPLRAHHLPTHRAPHCRGMSRTVPYLVELQPEFFCEVSPALAAQRGLTHGDWATIVTARQAVEGRVLVTARIKPLEVGGRTTHLIGVPYHWGGVGIVIGDSGNELLPVVLDNNVHISEYKVATCDIRPGRRPRGRARLDLVADYRRRARVNI